MARLTVESSLVRRRLDAGTWFGLILGVGVIFGALILSAKLSTFVHWPSLLLVVGGTAASSMIAAPLRCITALSFAVKESLFQPQANAQEALVKIVECANTARREGILALDRRIAFIDDSFLAEGLRMVVDGTPPVQIESALGTRIEETESRHDEGRAILESMAKSAPALGLIGTLIGLVVMLRNLDHPRMIGPSMAVALMTTLYGAALAHLILSPLAEKLSRRSREELHRYRLILRGLLSIQAGDNPRLVEQKLAAMLPLEPYRSGKPAVIAA